MDEEKKNKTNLEGKKNSCETPFFHDFLRTFQGLSHETFLGLSKDFFIEFIRTFSGLSKNFLSTL